MNSRDYKNSAPPDWDTPLDQTTPPPGERLDLGGTGRTLGVLIFALGVVAAAIVILYFLSLMMEPSY